jgi:hypothetical protein
MLESFAGLKHMSGGMVHRAWTRLAHELIQDTPEVLAVCEFDCRKPLCTYSEWSNCERRLKKAEGELMPIRNRTSPLSSTPKDAA